MLIAKMVSRITNTIKYKRHPYLIPSVPNIIPATRTGTNNEHIKNNMKFLSISIRLLLSVPD